MDIGYEKKQEFKPINKRAQWLFWIFIILIVVDVAAIWSGYAQAGLFKRAIAGETITWAEAAANDSREAAIGIAQGILIIAFLVVFLMWVHRAHQNLASLHATDLRFTPGWAVGWFFVPFMNLFRPYQVLSEIWKGSNPEVDIRETTSWKGVTTSPIVGLWWAFCLISTFVAQIAMRAAFSGEELSDLLTSTYAYMVSDGLDIVYIVLAILMVRGISQFQETKNRLLASI